MASLHDLSTKNLSHKGAIGPLNPPSGCCPGPDISNISSLLEISSCKHWTYNLKFFYIYDQLPTEIKSTARTG